MPGDRRGRSRSSEVARKRWKCIIKGLEVLLCHWVRCEVARMECRSWAFYILGATGLLLSIRVSLRCRLSEMGGRQQFRLRELMREVEVIL